MEPDAPLPSPDAAPADADDALRLFIAIELPAPVKAGLDELIGRLDTGCRFTPCRPAWVKADAIHLTLAFLGRREPAQVPDLEAMLDEVARPFAPFPLMLEDLGVFPDWRRPKVLWVGLRHRKTPLLALHGALSAALEPFDYTPERRAFHPHLTLARFRSLKGTAQVRPIVQQHAGQVRGSFEATALTLFSSRLDPEGAQYRALHVAPLGG